MLYHLFQYLESFDIPGAGLFQFILFRSPTAFITSLLISLLFGKRIILFLQKQQIGELVRDLGLEGQMAKKGTPTMGGLIIILSILVPTLLFADLTNIYIVLMIVTTVWLGAIGFIDDYIKVFKKDKAGLRERSKIIGQVGLGLIVGITLYMSDSVVIRNFVPKTQDSHISVLEGANENVQKEVFEAIDQKSTKTTIPFFKNNEFDYSSLVGFMGKYKQQAGWIVFVIIVIIIITAVSNGANLTDGLDGLAAGTTAISAVTLAALAYVSGHIVFAEYLNIMYIPHLSELAIFASALIGATVGFLWYNSYPAQVFMGDVGSLTLGGIIAVFAIIIRKEMLIPILCGVFLIENLSVMMQVGYFKYTKKRSGTGKRIFLMAPLHHHYQKKGYPEPKIVSRFWIVAIMLAIVAIVTLKIR